jgi:hypothetical protein
VREWLKDRRGVGFFEIALPEPTTRQAILDAYAKATSETPKLELILLTHLSHRTGGGDREAVAALCAGRRSLREQSDGKLRGLAGGHCALGTLRCSIRPWPKVSAGFDVWQGNNFSLRFGYDSRFGSHTTDNGGALELRAALSGGGTLAVGRSLPTPPQFLMNSRRALSVAPAVSSRRVARRVGRGIARSRVTESLIIGFQLGYGAMLPFPGLRQERAAMNRAEGRGLAVQRRDGAVSANVFHDGQAVHARISPFLFPGTNLRHNDF